MQKILELKNVSKFYYKNGFISVGIEDINLDFDIGEFVVITGESGSGKSTYLMFCLLLILIPKAKY